MTPAPFDRSSMTDEERAEWRVTYHTRIGHACGYGRASDEQNKAAMQEADEWIILLRKSHAFKHKRTT